MLRVADVLVVALTGWLAHWWYWGRPDLGAIDEMALIIAVLVTAAAFPHFGLYRVWRGGSLLDEIARLSLAWVTVAGIMVGLAFLAKMGPSFSRIWGATWMISGWLVLISSRILLRSVLNWLRGRGHNVRRIVVAGAHGLGIRVASRLMRERWAGLEVLGVFGDGLPNQAAVALESEGSQSGQADGAEPSARPPALGGLEDLAAYVAKHDLDQVWLALPLSDEARIRTVLYELRHSTADIRLVPELFELRLFHRPITEVAGLPVVELSVSPMSGDNRFLKALEDRVLALAILLLISPLLLVIALAVKLDSPGPVLFRQKRHGWGGKEIEIYKFRSMVDRANADEEAMQACRNDPRVTRLGAFLRRTSLDELPQFINVLQGRMSIVGPRPHPIWLNEQHMELIDAYMQRHKVKPGITGWAQVHGLRGETDTIEKMQKRVEYDLYYIENWSLWFDMKIMLMTVFGGLGYRNAY